MNSGGGGFANHVEFSLKRILHNHVVAASNEDLSNEGLLGAHGRRHGHVFVDGHIPPAQDHLARVDDGALHFLLTGLFGGLLFGQKDHAHAILPHCGQAHALTGHVFAVQGVGQLNQNASTIAHQFISTHGTTVVQVFQDLQGLGDHGVALHPLDVRHKTHATSIVLLTGVIQTRLIFCKLGFRLVHHALLWVTVAMKRVNPQGLTLKLVQEHSRLQQQCQAF